MVMDLEEILNDVKAIDKEIEALEEKRLAILGNDREYADYLRRVDNKEPMNSEQFHITVSLLNEMYEKRRFALTPSQEYYEAHKMVVEYEKVIGL